MKKTNRIQVAKFHKAKPGNICNGDDYFYIETKDSFLCAIADGLGSGTYARESSHIVIQTIKENVHLSIKQLVEKCNDQLCGKRGVVLGIFKIDFHDMQYAFTSIGNVGMMVITKNLRIKRMIPNAGYLSGRKKKFKITRGRVEPETKFLMFSDGVTDEDLATNFYHHQDMNHVIQSYILQKKNSENDDTTLLAFRYTENSPYLSNKGNYVSKEM